MPEIARDSRVVAVDWERLFGVLDRIAGGRSARLRVPEAAREALPVRRAFRTVAWVLGLVFLVGGAAVVQAVRVSGAGEVVHPVVWWRLLVIFAIAATLFYFWFRAQAGWWWAYSRLRLFSVVFPVIAVSTCLIPGLYPGWMIIEQLVFSALVLICFVLLSQPEVRSAYRKPAPPSAS
ncbi:MAG: hypothetical protein HZY73_00145 [Micropruina sp.]|nr:MAG: hypothetical protein HZY73_00145 [Micropruina sp.]